MQQQSKILIVDDHPTNVEILQKILQDDYHLAIAASGEEGLDIAPDFQPDLILLDIMMPGINGYETCRRIRAIPSLRFTKIIMVSAKAMASERLEGYEVGADDYMTKPFDKEELRAKVRVYLRLKSVEELDQLKSDVLSLLQHETRTPLNGIIGPAQLLAAEDPMDTEERMMLGDMVYESATRLQHFFDKVITLSTMRSGTWDFQFTPADLCDVVHAAADTILPYASAQNVQIDQDLPETAHTVLDWEQIHGVVAAMLKNAVRFSQPDSRVVVTVTHEDTHFCMTVSDQGEGIDAAFLPYVFEEFVDADIQHHTEGQRLSLAIARRVVLAHSGTMSVDSTKGIGTTFTVRLPMMASTTEDGSLHHCASAMQEPSHASSQHAETAEELLPQTNTIHRNDL